MVVGIGSGKHVSHDRSKVIWSGLLAGLVAGGATLEGLATGSDCTGGLQEGAAMAGVVAGCDCNGGVVAALVGCGMLWDGGPGIPNHASIIARARLCMAGNIMTACCWT